MISSKWNKIKNQVTYNLCSRCAMADRDCEIRKQAEMDIQPVEWGNRGTCTGYEFVEDFVGEELYEEETY